jgi:hypothetical protein
LMINNPDKAKTQYRFFAESPTNPAVDIIDLELRRSNKTYRFHTT